MNALKTRDIVERVMFERSEMSRPEIDSSNSILATHYIEDFLEDVDAVVKKSRETKRAVKT